MMLTMTEACLFILWFCRRFGSGLVHESLGGSAVTYPYTLNMSYVFGSRNSDPQYLGATCCHPGAFQEELPSVPTSSTDCRGRCYIDHPAPKCLSRHNVAVALKGGRVTSASKPLISPRELDRHVPGHFDVHSLENIQHTRVPTHTCANTVCTYARMPCTQTVRKI